jgi:hypothetical protein
LRLLVAEAPNFLPKEKALPKIGSAGFMRENKEAAEAAAMLSLPGGLSC